MICTVLLLMHLAPATVLAGGLPPAVGLVEARAREEVIARVEVALKQAARKSPKWHSKQASIQRDVHDITYLVEQAVKASITDNHVSAQEYARQASALLQRALTRDHFHPDDVAPVMRELQRLIPNRAL
ncbi:hypothetical protein [Nitrospira moscoviensis]|uniref:Uncharacterized protein n=1 Tax=Nitrospira moscoviensis TaxID=42253 RepID=A0A0K2GHV8_NITMO|nr:hypothetical protein [Nitrospira moscoviensis]ALA60429.1 exported protein of unknown function [Nitrospira moscoviensis]